MDLSSSASAQLQLGAASLLLPDDTTLTTCPGASNINVDLIRLNKSSSPTFLEICDTTGWVIVGGADIWQTGTSDDVYYDATTPQVGIGTTTPSNTLDIAGTFQVSGLSTFGSPTNFTGLATFNTGVDVTGTANFDDIVADQGGTFNQDIDLNANLDISGSISDPDSPVMINDSLSVNTDSSGVTIDATSATSNGIRLSYNGTTLSTPFVLYRDDYSSNSFTIDSAGTALGNAFEGTWGGNANYPVFIPNDADSNTGIYSGGADAIAFGTGATQRMLIDNSEVSISNDLDVSGDIDGTDITASGSVNAGTTVNVNGDQLGPALNCTSSQKLEWSNGSGWSCATDLQGGSGGGVPALDDVSDVDATSPTDGDCIIYNDGTGDWEHGPCSGSSAGIFEVASNVTRVKSTAGDYANDDFVFGSPQLDDDNDADHEARMYFDKSKGAFRAGTDSLGRWDESNVGTNSTAFGNTTSAEGDESFAAGRLMTAGTQSFAFGNEANASNGSFVFASQNGTGTRGATGTSTTAFILGASSAAGPYVSGTSSFGIFFGDNTGYDLTADNRMALVGATDFMIDDDGSSGSQGCLRYDGSAGLLEYSDDCSTWYSFTDDISGLWTEISSTLIHFGTDETYQVGIGTNSPQTTLDVNGGVRVGTTSGGDTPSFMNLGNLGDVSASSPSDGDCVIYNSVSGDWENTSCSAATSSYSIEDANGDTIIQVEESSDENIIRFDTAGTERMIISATGEVGIGTTSPNVDLEVSKPSGDFPRFRLSSGDVTNADFTGSQTLSNTSTDNTFGQLQMHSGHTNSDTDGGLVVMGMSSSGVNDWQPLTLLGQYNSTSPTAASVSIVGQKHDGSDNRDSLSGSEIILDVARRYDNDSDIMFRFQADGSLGVGTYNIDSNLHIYDDGGSAELRLDGDGSAVNQIVFEENDQGDNFTLQYDGADNQFNMIGLGGAYNLTMERDTGLTGLGDFSSDTIESRLHLEDGAIRLDGGAGNEAGCIQFNDTSDQLEYSDDCTTYAAFSAGSGASAINDLSDAYTDYTTDNNMVLGHTGATFTSGGYSNILIGETAGDAITTGNRNVAIGYNALSTEDEANENIALGTSALEDNDGGGQNTAVGDGSMANNTTGGNNTAVGDDTLDANLGGGGNTAIGAAALSANTNAFYSTALGYHAGQVSSGADNTFIGASAGESLTTGEDNVFVGKNAASTQTAGDENIAIGENAHLPNLTGSYQLNIGNLIYGDLANAEIGLGDFSADTIDAQLHLKDGAIRLDGGAGNEAGCIQFNDTSDQLEYSDDCTTYAAFSAGGGSLWTDNTTHITREGIHIFDAGTTMASGGFDFGNAWTSMLFVTDQYAIVGGEHQGLDDGYIGNGSFAWGHDVFAAGDYSIALGYSSAAHSTGTNIAIGQQASSNNSSISIGAGTNATGSESYAFGKQVTSSAAHSIAFGAGETAGTAPEVSGDNSIGFFIADQDSVNLSDANTVSIMGASGGVGIGTVSPNTDLEVFSANNSMDTILRITSGVDNSNTARSEIQLIEGNSGGYDRGVNMFYDGSAGDHFGIEVINSGGSTEALRVERSTGYIGIANTAPNVELDVTGDIEYTGTITDVSDRRLKNNIRPLSNSENILDRIDQINTYSFTMKNDKKGRTEFGVMAQEMEIIFPELVHTATDKMGTKSVNYMGLIAPMIEATKELKTKNELLKSEISDLKAIQYQTHTTLTDLSKQVELLNKVTGKSVGRASMLPYIMLLIGIFSGMGIMITLQSRQQRP